MCGRIVRSRTTPVCASSSCRRSAWTAGGTILAHTPTEDLQRYVFDFTKKAGEDEFGLWLDTNLPGRILFEYAKTEILQ